MRIRTAIFGVYVFAAAIGFAALMYFILREVRPRYVGSIQRTMDDAARMLGAALAEDWLAQGAMAPDRLQRVVKASVASQSGLRVRVVGRDGQLLADSSGEPVAEGNEGVAKRFVGRVFDSRPGAAPADELQAAAPIRVDGCAVAEVVLIRPVRTLNEFIWAERKKLAGGGLAIAAVMVVAGWWIATRLTHSLERLTAYVETVRDGRKAELPATGAREVAKLGRAFEEMREALEGRQHLERTTQALAHGIKAPLAAVRAAAELLGEELPPEDRRRFMENLRGESGRIEQIVERLLRLSALEACRVLPASGRIEVAALLAEVENGIRSAGMAAGVRLRIGPAAGAVRGDAALLREALTNLVQNAVEFTPRGGEVTLAADVRGAWVEVTVDDTGAGVPDYALARVFERFYSLERPGTGRKSTGLGLALVAEIAHLHGGEAALANRPEGGTRATLRVPAG